TSIILNGNVYMEMTFLRNFFRLDPQKLPPGRKGDELLAAFPFGVVKTSRPRVLTPKIFLDGTFVDGALALSVDYVYNAGGLSIGMPSQSGSLLVGAKRAWKRDVELENGFETALDLFGFAVSDNSALLPKDDTMLSPGIFLDETLPQLARTYPQLVLGASLGRISGGGSGLPELPFHCKFVEGDEEKSTISYSFGGLVPEIAWNQVAEAAENHSPFISGPSGPVRIGESLGRLMRALPSALSAVDPTRGTFDLPRCSSGYYLKLAGDVQGAAVPELFSGLPPSMSTPSASDFEMTGTLRKYQSDGVAFMQWMTDRGLGVLLADEMGLGKTVQVLALIASRRRRNDPPVLVLCPTSLIANWERETARFVPGLRVSAPIGRERSKDIADVGSYDMLVMSYAAARNSTAALSAVRFSYIVLDEAQHIKNPGTDNARICKNLSGAHRIVLSGTPLENSPEDLWSIFDFLQPGMLGTLAGFRRRYTGLMDSEELRADLLARVSPFILRRTKAQVASDLPERCERIVYCDFGIEQRKLYDSLVEESRTRLGELRQRGKRNGVDVLALLMRIRQLCCHPGLLPDGAGNGVPSAKTELLMELLQENIDSSHKVLVFSQFPTFLRLLVPLLDKAGIRYEYLDGGTRDRQERIDRFNSDPGIPVFLLSLKAGGTGFNLTSADRVIIYDPWWNPAAELQAADRTHRIGQTKPVTTMKLVARDTIEERILSMQDGKLKLFESLVVSGEKLSIDDIAALLDGKCFN
ncbi:MAG: SNF2 family helicase, partial [Victivallaceae bacterium]|nr:SNF2 family helicase [Victivallaceae bacterium]